MTVTLDLDTLRPRGTEVDAAPESWLHASVAIDGVLFNLDAIAVHCYRGLQHVEAEAFEDALDSIGIMTAADKPFVTIRLNTRNYVLLLTPSSV
ncbi:MAG: hypothetical protein DIJKHBIC_02323 [Thermoanaerobaculia bacterium]|nr:hypothetical protein [Thermoanaerobaculia bacterium]